MGGAIITRSHGGKIEAGKLGDLGVQLQQQREGLADATRSTKDGDLEATLVLGSDGGPLQRGARDIKQRNF
jgi:hypothetical protein